MDRSIHSVTGHIGGVCITVSAKTRLRLRRFSRAAGTLAGQRLRQSGKPEIWHRRGAARFQFCRPAERGGGLGL